tara:strand:+ start:388 stop:1092 length:705 start_codon:yes stop_codon:yes gene_type:complete
MDRFKISPRNYKKYDTKLEFVPHYMTSKGLVNKYRKDLSATIFFLCPKSPKIIFDVGANMGVYTSLLARYYAKTSIVYAFEPVKFNFKNLAKNIELNQITNVSFHNFGFYSQEGTMELGLPINRKDGNRNENTGLYTYQGKRRYLVKCNFKRLDYFMKERKIEKIDIMKIDVEGAEHEILSSSEKVLSKIQYIYIELGREVDENNKTWQLLTKHNFKLVKKRRSNYLFGATNEA